MQSGPKLRGDRGQPGGLLSHFIYVSVSVMAVLLLAVMIVLLIVNGKPVAAQLHFNWYALLSGVSFVSNLVALLFIARIKERTDTLMWFSFFLFTVTLWAGTEAVLRLSSTPASALFWTPFTTLGSNFMPVAFYMFVLAYTSTKRALSPLVFPILVGVSTMLIFMDISTHLLDVYSVPAMKAVPWGFIPTTGPAYFLLSLWFILVILAALLLLVDFRRHSVEPIIRQQTKLFIIAVTIPLVGGTITDGILPALNIVAIPPSTNVLLAVMGILICYGIRKYKLFSFTPGLIASHILSTMNEAVIGLTPDYRLSYINSGTERLLGFTGKYLIDRPLNELLVGGWTAAQVQQKIFDNLKNTDIFTINTISFLTADGGSVTTELSITKVVGEDQPYGYLLVLTDITALMQAQMLIEQKVVDRTKQLHEEQAKLWASIEGLKLGFVLADTNGLIVLQNKALESIFNITGPAATLAQIEQLLDSVALAANCQTVKNSGQPINFEADGQNAKNLQIFIGPVAVEENNQKRIIGTVLLFEDITEAKILERSKDEFFSIASHELRTPLTSIRGNSGMIMEYYKDILKDEQLKEMIEDMHTSSIRLIDIVTDFLDMSRLEQGKMSFKPEAVALGPIMKNIIFEMQPIITEKGVKIEADSSKLGDLPLVWGDPSRIKQILYNLVGNAVKYIEKDNGAVTISAGLQGANVKVTVMDNGAGISEANKKLLFRKFQQASDSILTRDATHGTGLGLYISRMMAEAMGGSVTLDKTAMGRGSTFSFVIPVATAEHQILTVRPDSAVDTNTGLTVKSKATKTFLKDIAGN